MVDVSGKKFFDIFVNTGQICIVFEADKLENYKKNMPILEDLPTKIWFKSYFQANCLFVNNF